MDLLISMNIKSLLWINIIYYLQNIWNYKKETRLFCQALRPMFCYTELSHRMRLGRMFKVSSRQRVICKHCPGALIIILNIMNYIQSDKFTIIHLTTTTLMIWWLTFRIMRLLNIIPHHKKYCIVSDTNFFLVVMQSLEIDVKQ